MTMRRLQQGLQVLEWPLPGNNWLLLLVLMVMAVCPFFSWEWLPALAAPLSPYLPTGTVALAAYAVVYILLSGSLIFDDYDFAVHAKRFGQAYEPTDVFGELEEKPWRGFARLAGAVLVVAAVMVTAVSSILYASIHHFGIPSPFGIQPSVRLTDVMYGFIHHARFDGPFGVVPTRLEILWYFLDQTAKGVFFDFCEVFGISLQTRLRMSSQLTSLSPYLLFVYRLIMSLMTLQILRLGLAYILRGVDSRSDFPKTQAEAAQLRAALQRALQDLEEKRHRSQHELRELAGEYHELLDRRSRQRRGLGGPDWARLNVLDRILTLHHFSHRSIERKRGRSRR